jgi:hypothetical protein
MDAELSIRLITQIRPKGVLFHYTSAQGLLGIFDSKHIWASSAYHLNDSREYRYAIELVKQAAVSRLRYANGPDNRICGELVDELGTMAASFQMFVASFSEENDLLSQWMAYGGGKNGYAIGIRRAHLRSSFRDGFSLIRCIYDEEEHQRLASYLLEMLIRIFSDRNGSNDELTKLVIAGFAAIKHPGFKQEKEWRLVKGSVIAVQSTTEVSFREGRNGVVPYMSAPLFLEKGKFVPDSITLGPNDDPDAAETAAHSLLASKGLLGLFTRSRTKVISSKTPYRP